MIVEKILLQAIDELCDSLYNPETVLRNLEVAESEIDEYIRELEKEVCECSYCGRFAMKSDLVDAEIEGIEELICGSCEYMLEQDDD